VGAVVCDLPEEELAEYLRWVEAATLVRARRVRTLAAADWGSAPGEPIAASA
jgi:hypothetical protein